MLYRRMNIVAFWFITVPILLALVMNIAIYYFGWGRRTVRNSKLPAGWVIGMIWVIILGLLGYATYKAYITGRRLLMWMLIGLIGLCIAYPVYTGGLTERRMMLGNRVSLIYGFVVGMIAMPDIARWMIPLLIWLSYVNLVM